LRAFIYIINYPTIEVRISQTSLGHLSFSSDTLREKHDFTHTLVEVASLQILGMSAYIARWFLARLIFDLENRGDTLIRNVGSFTDYTALHPRR
jgi:hypothetical protein